MQAVVVPTVFRDFDDYWQPHLLGGSSPAQRYVASLGEGQRTALRERLKTMLPIADDGSVPLLGTRMGGPRHEGNVAAVPSP